MNRLFLIGILGMSVGTSSVILAASSYQELSREFESIVVPAAPLVPQFESSSFFPGDFRDLEKSKVISGIIGISLSAAKSAIQNAYPIINFTSTPGPLTLYENHEGVTMLSTNVINLQTRVSAQEEKIRRTLSHLTRVRLNAGLSKAIMVEGGAILCKTEIHLYPNLHPVLNNEIIATVSLDVNCKNRDDKKERTVISDSNYITVINLNRRAIAYSMKRDASRGLGPFIDKAIATLQ